jgi:hypothetical protein
MKLPKLVTKYILMMCLVVAFVACPTFAQECDSSSKRTVTFDPRSAKSLLSPDRQWRLLFVGPKPADQTAALYIQSTRSSQKWKVAVIERSATAFWSDDSKRAFLRDEYAADDTRIRLFEVSSSTPSEIEGLDHKIRQAIYARIPEIETSLWLYYPQACFAARDPSTIILDVDAPLVLKREDSKGKGFSLKLTVHVTPFRICVSGQKAPTFP